MPRFLRYLRIAFSATCGIACVLLVVLWVRSYWWYDELRYKCESDAVQPWLGRVIKVASFQGRLTTKIVDDAIMNERWLWYRVELPHPHEYKDHYGKSSDGPWFHVL